MNQIKTELEHLGMQEKNFPKDVRILRDFYFRKLIIEEKEKVTEHGAVSK